MIMQSFDVISYYYLEILFEGTLLVNFVGSLSACIQQTNFN